MTVIITEENNDNSLLATNIRKRLDDALSYDCFVSCLEMHNTVKDSLPDDKVVTRNIACEIFDRYAVQMGYGMEAYTKYNKRGRKVTGNTRIG